MKTRAEQEEAVRRFYDAEVGEEEARLDEYPFEFAVTMRFVDQYLQPGAKVLDAACGTGRYAKALIDAGYRVGAGDLAPANVQCTQRRTSSDCADSQVLFVRQANALDQEAYEGGPWDAILLLGPCYHLPALDDRIALLHQARSNLREDGRVYVSFISRLGAFAWGVQHRPEGILEREGVLSLFHRGTEYNFARPGEALPNTYFCDPAELNSLFDEARLSVKHLCGTEGVFGGRVRRYHELDETLREEWLNFMVEHCESPMFSWTSEHLLVVAERA